MYHIEAEIYVLHGEITQKNVARGFKNRIVKIHAY